MYDYISYIYIIMVMPNASELECPEGSAQHMHGSNIIIIIIMQLYRISYKGKPRRAHVTAKI